MSGPDPVPGHPAITTRYLQARRGRNHGNLWLGTYCNRSSRPPASMYEVWRVQIRTVSSNKESQFAKPGFEELAGTSPVGAAKPRRNDLTLDYTPGCSL
jgi:hypothetical protein